MRFGLTGLVIPEEVNSWISRELVIMPSDEEGGDPSIIDTSRAKPCKGHWHIETDWGILTIGPDSGPFNNRRVVIFADGTDDAVIEEILRRHGKNFSSGVDPRWHEHVAMMEYDRLSEKERQFVLTLHLIEDNDDLMWDLDGYGIDPRVVAQIFVDGEGDEDTIRSAILKLFEDAGEPDFLRALLGPDMAAFVAEAGGKVHQPIPGVTIIEF